MSTIKDVARLAGVSPSTVSRVVNGNTASAASEETRQRIWEAVRATNYSVNSQAQKLRRPKQDEERPKQSIDCVFARGIDYFIDPFFIELIHVIEQRIFKQGYCLRTQYGAADMNSHLRSDKHKKDAAIILGRVDAEILEKLKQTYRHLVYVSLQDRDLGIDSVICSGYESAGLALNYLYSLGHRRICYLGEIRDEQRYDAYRDFVAAHGLEELVVDVRFTPSDSYEGLRSALAGGMSCTAVFCANDVSAVGVYRAARECHLSIPKELSIISVNDIETVRYLEPMLSTIHIPIEELGAHAASLLIDRIERGHTLPVRLYLPCQLVERDSCRKLR